MKLNLFFSSLFAANTLMISHLISEEGASLFQSQPVHLRNARQEKEPAFTEMTILDVSSVMQIEAIAERVLYGDADVVHLAYISPQKAFRLYEILQDAYSHFIHVPMMG